jgi:hypothetical protein
MKSQGGFSLEMTDISNPCLDALNWRASGHPDGGTPGGANFNSATLHPDLKIDGICCVNDLLLEVLFSQAIDSLAASDADMYSISPEGLSITSASPLPPSFTKVRLHLSQPGIAGMIYELEVQPTLENCLGELLEMPVTASFGWQQDCAPFDVVINEILFNPLGDGVDYVELLNRSEKAILLSELTLASARETPPNPPDTQYAALTDKCRSILPGEYLVLTKDAEMVKQQYTAKDPDAFLEMDYFPAFNNDEGNVLLFRDMEVIDGFSYSNEMHFLMLSSTEGVSLERICPDRLGDDAGNWHSSAETAGFGTPGYRNSQYLEKWSDESVLSLHPVTFSPDGDGIDDQLGITYNFGEPGKLVSVLVFSSEGRLTRTLVNNEMPGTSGIFSWDGTMDDRAPALEGIYIVYMEALGMDGRTIHQRKACVLARRM